MGACLGDFPRLGALDDHTLHPSPSDFSLQTQWHSAMKTQSKQVWRASCPHLLQAGLQTVSNTRNPNCCCPPSFSSPLSPPALPGEPDLHHPKSLYSKQTCGINNNSSHVLFLPADSLFLVGGTGPPGASFLLAGRQVFLLTHSTAAPRLRAIDGRH